MAHTGIFATAAECASKAGANISAAGWVEANINQWCSEAESYINTITGRNWSDAYSTLNADVKKILTECASNLVGIYGINYDMSVFSNIVEAENKITVLAWRVEKLLEQLKDKNVELFIDGETS